VEHAIPLSASVYKYGGSLYPPLRPKIKSTSNVKEYVVQVEYKNRRERFTTSCESRSVAISNCIYRFCSMHLNMFDGRDFEKVSFSQKSIALKSFIREVSMNGTTKIVGE